MSSYTRYAAETSQVIWKVPTTYSASVGVPGVVTGSGIDLSAYEGLIEILIVSQGSGVDGSNYFSAQFVHCATVGGTYVAPATGIAPANVVLTANGVTKIVVDKSSALQFGNLTLTKVLSPGNQIITVFSNGIYKYKP